MVGWHHRLNGLESEQALGDAEGQGTSVLQSAGSQRVRHDLVTEYPEAGLRLLAVCGLSSAAVSFHTTALNTVFARSEYNSHNANL